MRAIRHFLGIFLRFIELNVIASHRIRIIFDFSNFVDSKISRREEEGKREKKFDLLLISREKKKRKKKEFRIHCCPGIALGKGRQSFKVRGFITPTQSCQSSIRVFIINFPIVVRVPIKRGESRGIFITRSTLLRFL